MLVGFCLGCVVASWYATNENMVAAGPLYPPPSLFPLNFLVVGDWGRRGRYNQTLVAAQVWNLQKRNSWSLQRNNCFILSLSLSLSRLRSSTSLRSTLCKLLPHFRIYLVKGWDHILWALVLGGCLILFRYDWNSWGEKSTQWWLLHFQDHFVSLIAIGLFFCRQSSVATINMICWWGPVSRHLSVVGSCADGKSWTRSQHWLCDFCWRQLLSAWTDRTWGPEVFRFIHWHLHSSKLAENLVYWYISTSPLFPALGISMFNIIKTPTTIAKAWNDGLTLYEWLL